MASETVIDIRTRFIPENRKVFFVFPGSGYRHYQMMREANAVYLDVPGFPIPQNRNIAALSDIVERLAIADDVADWHRRGMPGDAIPSRDPDTVTARRRSKRRIFLAGIMRGLFSDAAKGDVVIVPPKDFQDDVLFGEFVDDGTECTVVAAPFHAEESIPARGVRWLATQKRITLPGWLEQKMPSPNPVRQLERQYHKYVFDILYERYYFDQQFVCKFGINANDFSTLDNFLVQQIFLYTCALFENNHEENIENISDKSLLEVVSEIEFSADIPDQRIEIQSPGNIILYSRNIIPLVTGVLMMLSALAPAGEVPKNIKIVNTADDGQTSKECEVDIAKEVETDLQLMGVQRWIEWCKAEKEARKRTEIQPGMQIQLPDGDQNDPKKK
jgi:hypothetical protein